MSSGHPITIPPGITVDWAQVEPHLRDADFYDATSPVATITGPRGTILVQRTGESRLQSAEPNSEFIEEPAQFRSLFPDGALPDQTTTPEWIWYRNGWFFLESGPVDDDDDTTAHDVYEAVADAVERVMLPAALPTPE